jgi:hypothetical protein
MEAPETRGLCSECFGRTLYHEGFKEESGLQDVHFQMELGVVTDIAVRIREDAFEESFQRDTTNAFTLNGRIHCWKAVDIQATVGRIDNSDGQILLNDIQLCDIDLTDVLKAPRQHPVAVLSWRWDITNRTPELEFFLQKSRNMALAFEKANSLNIHYLFVDAMSLPQFPHVDLDELVTYCELFSRIRVITTFVAQEWQHGMNFMCASYPLRGWLLVESSRYLNNPCCTLKELIRIDPTKNTPETNEDPMHGYMYGVLNFARQFLQPLQTGHSDDPAFLHPEIMPARAQADLPVTQVFTRVFGGNDSKWNSKGRLFSFAGTLCQLLAQGEDCMYDVVDMVKAGTNALYG